jgi:hypothetical protein
MLLLLLLPFFLLFPADEYHSFNADLYCWLDRPFYLQQLTIDILSGKATMNRFR